MNLIGWEQRDHILFHVACIPLEQKRADAFCHGTPSTRMPVFVVDKTGKLYAAGRKRFQQHQSVVIAAAVCDMHAAVLPSG
ncbi:hypothetical protein DO72_5165 [Burkholderia pseudomallei]|nr:hypothetical protein DO72_5165 [Burkholderia pseudomallei]